MSAEQPVSGPAAARRALHETRVKQAAQIAGTPALHLLVWRSAQSMRLSLVIYHSRPGGRRSCTILREAEWRPKEITERALVEWGQRAMADWLSNPTLHGTTDQAYPLA